MLEHLRRAIQEAARRARQRISYRIPTFFHDGGLVAFHAGKGHCGSHIMGKATKRAFAGELGGYRTSVATVRFPCGGRLPVGLVKRNVRARARENEQRAEGRGARKRRRGTDARA